MIHFFLSVQILLDLDPIILMVLKYRAQELMIFFFSCVCVYDTRKIQVVKAEKRDHHMVT